jgi:hypothetical protein
MCIRVSEGDGKILVRSFPLKMTSDITRVAARDQAGALVKYQKQEVMKLRQALDEIATTTRPNPDKQVYYEATSDSPLSPIMLGTTSKYPPSIWDRFSLILDRFIELGYRPVKSLNHFIDQNGEDHWYYFLHHYSDPIELEDYWE